MLLGQGWVDWAASASPVHYSHRELGTPIGYQSYYSKKFHTLLLAQSQARLRSRQLDLPNRQVQPMLYRSVVQRNGLVAPRTRICL